MWNTARLRSPHCRHHEADNFFEQNLIDTLVSAHSITRVHFKIQLNIVADTVVL